MKKGKKYGRTNKAIKKYRVVRGTALPSSYVILDKSL